MAIKIKIKIREIVQINSIRCPWRRKRSDNKFFIENIKMKKIIKVMNNRKIKVKSWKKIIIS